MTSPTIPTRSHDDASRAPALTPVNPASRTRGWTKVAPPIALTVAFVLTWHLIAASELISRLIVPFPWAVAESFAEITWGNGLIWPHAWVTVAEALAGFGLGSAAAALVAVIAAVSPAFNRMVYPFMVAFQVTPRIAVAPIIIAWLGFGMAPKVVIGATICFFPVFLNMLTGLLSAEPTSLEMFRSLGASKRKVFTHLMLPTALPITFAGLQTGISFALIGVIVGEFISASQGLGYLIKAFSFELNIPGSYAVLLALTIIGLLLFGAMKAITKFVVFWQSDDGLTARSARKAARSRERDI